MMQILLFTITAIFLYVGSDWILVRMEQWRGKPFASRSLVFFIIILIMSVAAFEGAQRFLAGKPQTPVENPATNTSPTT